MDAGIGNMGDTGAQTMAVLEAVGQIDRLTELEHAAQVPTASLPIGAHPQLRR